MIWIQAGGKTAPQHAVDLAFDAHRQYNVPVGILLATCEAESNFRLGLVSSADAVGPMQFKRKFADDYYRYAGFAFKLDDWESMTGAAAVFATYARWGEARGFTGDDRWRFALVAHRWGQNSAQAQDPAKQQRVLFAEEAMRRNGLWYDHNGPMEEDEQMEAQAVAAAAAKWAVEQVGSRYSQADRLKDGVYDCSSLVARAYAAQGAVMTCKGGPTPTSNQEVYDDSFRLIWPGSYDKIGKSYGGAAQIALATQPGDLQFLRTQSSGRANKITHVTMVADGGRIVHARGTSYGVRLDRLDLYAGKVCALLRYDPTGPLRRGMQGNRVRALQAALGGLEVDGVYGAQTEDAVRAYQVEQDLDVTGEADAATLAALGQQEPGKPAGPAYATCTGNGVNLRQGPGTGYPTLGRVAKESKLLAGPEEGGWRPVAAYLDGKLAAGYMAAQYVQEVEA